MTETDSTDTDSIDSTTSEPAGPEDAGQDGRIDSDDAEGDAISGVTSDEDGAPTPTGSIPPGPGTPDDEDTTDPTTLPPLSERLY